MADEDIIAKLMATPGLTQNPIDAQPPAIPSQTAPYVAPGQHVYNTPLQPAQESAFQQWVAENKVPFDVSAPVSDYDMRGFYQGLMAKDPRALTAIDPHDKQLHYPDYWKTPYHETFSNESQWATPDAPAWDAKDRLVAKDGTVVFDPITRSER